jgi:hypothetical protein
MLEQQNTIARVDHNKTCRTAKLGRHGYIPESG